MVENKGCSRKCIAC